MTSVSRNISPSRVEVQCADPELKREAISELFNHYHDSATIPARAAKTLAVRRVCTAEDGKKARPYSASFELVLPSSASANIGIQVDTSIAAAPTTATFAPADCSYEPAALWSPLPTPVASPVVSESEQPVGLFANLRKQLYGDRCADDLV